MTTTENNNQALSSSVSLEEARERGYTYTIVSFKYRDGMHEYEEVAVFGVKMFDDLMDAGEIPDDWEDEGMRQKVAYVKGYLTPEQYDLARNLEVVY